MKVWFITGAGSGLGTGIAKAALSAGDHVVATGRNLEKVRNVYPDVAQENIAFVQLAVARRRRHAVVASGGRSSDLGRLPKWL
jgi:NADP-dependent 3-hydroxy acid dehydrogenase YdfG